jgi:hypothetical protein
MDTSELNPYNTVSEDVSDLKGETQAKNIKIILRKRLWTSTMLGSW